MNLNLLRQGVLRTIIGGGCLTKVGAAIHGGNAENMLTASAANYIINGRFYTKAAQTEMDISALYRLEKDDATPFEAESWSVAAAAGGFTAIADDFVCKYLFVLDSSGNIRIVEGTQVAITETAEWPDIPDDGSYVPFCGVEVKNESGANFTLGTTELSTGGVTDTYYDLAYVPGQ